MQCLFRKNKETNKYFKTSKWLVRNFRVNEIKQLFYKPKLFGVNHHSVNHYF